MKETEREILLKKQKEAEWKILLEKEKEEEREVFREKQKAVEKVMGKLPELKDWASRAGYRIYELKKYGESGGWEIKNPRGTTNNPIGSRQTFKSEIELAHHLISLREMSLPPEQKGYIDASSYAKREDAKVEDVIQHIREGTLKGEIIKNSWYVKIDD